MPSWNIHIAHVERLLADHTAEELGIADADAFLFGNLVPDIYLGFMVPDTTYRIDYCLTHVAQPCAIPVPDADTFWDECICHPLRCPKTAAGWSLALGAWAHLAADRMYNARFRSFCEEHDLTPDDELRERKQADFAIFGNSLGASRHVRVTPELLEAAQAFRPYSILPDDVRRAVEVADGIVDIEADGISAQFNSGRYRLLSADWLQDTFDACDQLLATWLATWRQLRSRDADCAAANIAADRTAANIAADIHTLL